MAFLYPVIWLANSYPPIKYRGNERGKYYPMKRLQSLRGVLPSSFWVRVLDASWWMVHVVFLLLILLPFWKQAFFTGAANAADFLWHVFFSLSGFGFKKSLFEGRGNEKEGEEQCCRQTPRFSREADGAWKRKYRAGEGGTGEFKVLTGLSLFLYILFNSLCVDGALF